MEENERLAGKQLSHRYSLGASGKAAVIFPCLQNPYRHCGDVSFGASVEDATISHNHYPYKYHTLSNYPCISVSTVILVCILRTFSKFCHPLYLHRTMRLTVRDTKEQVGNYVSGSLSHPPDTCLLDSVPKRLMLIH